MRHAARVVGLERLASLVDIATVPYGVDEDRVLRSEDFENNAVRAFAEFVQTAELALEGKQLGRVQIRGEPVNSIQDTFGNIPIEPFKLLGRALEESNGIQLQSKSFSN